MRTNPKHGFLASYPIKRRPGAVVAVKTSLNVYCQSRHISRNQAWGLARKKWLAVTKIRGRLYVEEVCPEMIEAWFGDLT